MTALSSRRPVFLSRSQRRWLAFKRTANWLSIITLSAFAAGYFFGG